MTPRDNGLRDELVKANSPSKALSQRNNLKNSTVLLAVCITESCQLQHDPYRSCDISTGAALDTELTYGK
jgi:hypothetical protein